MTEDIPFLERRDYMINGVRKYRSFVLRQTRIEREKSKSGTSRRVSGEDFADMEPETKERSALAIQYCAELHKWSGIC